MNEWLGVTIAGIGIFGAPVMMAVHLLGSFSGWWGHGHVTWYIPLLGFVLVALGNGIDTYRGKKFAEAQTDS